MPKLIVFNSVTLDGYFTGKNGDLSWAHSGEDKEWNDFVVENSTRTEGPLIFGRTTYDMMIAFWPTPEAAKQLPAIAKQMNSRPKVVFSKTLDKASWNNTKVVKGSLPAEIRKMKKAPGDDMTILGSGSIVSQLAQEGLIDEYHVVVVPIVIGEGKTMFDGMKKKLQLTRKASRTFKNGNVLLSYDAKANA